MFIRKEREMLYNSYFEVIRESEQFIEVRSINTGHCWSIFRNTYERPGMIKMYLKHKESDSNFH